MCHIRWIVEGVKDWLGPQLLEAGAEFIRTSVCDGYSGSMKIITRLDHISHCKTASGANWSNRWTYRIFF